MTDTFEYPWEPGAGQRLVDDLRPFLNSTKHSKGDEVTIPRHLLRRFQQCGLYLAQMETHKSDVESARQRAYQAEKNTAAIRVDTDRKFREAHNREADLLRLLYRHGVRTAEVDAQVAWDRKQAKLAGEPDPYGVQSGVQMDLMGEPS